MGGMTNTASTTSRTTSTILICDDCACGVANDDWSFLDYDLEPEESEAALQSISAMLELTGWLTATGRTGEGYFTCALCNDVSVDGNEYATERNLSEVG